MVGGYEKPFPGLGDMSRQYGYMGQDLLNVPSVEGWHYGAEWINSGSLMRRINFTADMFGDGDAAAERRKDHAEVRQALIYARGGGKGLKQAFKQIFERPLTKFKSPLKKYFI